MKILVKVTKEILSKAKLCGLVPGRVGENCAIALAIRDLFEHAWVSRYDIVIYDRDQWVDTGAIELLRMRLPDGARRFILEFDGHIIDPERRENMSTYSFEINVPDSFLEQIGLEEVKKILSVSESLEYIQV